MALRKNCEGTTRRDCLQFGIGGLLGGSLINTLRVRGESAGVSGGPKPTADHVILIWMDGGPTHFETFDPKPDAPAEFRGEFGYVKTSVPGVLYSEHMVRLAAGLDDCAMIRSIRHSHGNHGAGNHYMMTGAPTRIPVGCGAFVSFHPSMGSVIAKERGKDNGLPPYFTTPRMSRSGGPSFLGAKHAPFVVPDNPNTEKFKVRDVALPRDLAVNRFDRRTDLRSKIDKLVRLNSEVAGDPVAAFDEYQEQGYSLVTSPRAQQAFDISKESGSMRERYGRNEFGQRCLLARRLVEAGVPFITVYDGGWDSHRNLFGSLGKRLPNWDNSVATLIQDLKERGLLDTTLVIAMGEFGRTPRISTLSGTSSPGRDHWANAMSVLMAGGGTPGGTVVGSTDRKGYAALDRVLSPENLMSTIYHKMGIDPGQILYTPDGRPVHLVSDPAPISELI
ncbi:MAG: DUF1501 domain-containing protein [Fuerstiella sp.]|nr:DUF1501 domain-containing protein [Fuerstiella sp.]